MKAIGFVGWVVLAGLACSGGPSAAPPPAPVAPPQVASPEVEPPSPAMTVPEAERAGAGRGRPRVERTPDRHVLLYPFPLVDPACGYEHRDAGGRLLAVERVTVPDLVVNVEGRQRQLPLDPHPALPGRIDSRTYADGDVRVDITRDESAKTALIEAMYGEYTQDLDTRTSFDPSRCGD